MNSIIFLVVTLSMLTTGTSQTLKTRFTEWVEKFEMKATQVSIVEPDV